MAAIAVKGNKTSTPKAPAEGVVLWFDGTNLQAINAAGLTVTVTNRSGNPQTWA